MVSTCSYKLLIYLYWVQTDVNKLFYKVPINYHYYYYYYHYCGDMGKSNYVVTSPLAIHSRLCSKTMLDESAPSLSKVAAMEKSFIAVARARGVLSQPCCPLTRAPLSRRTVTSLFLLTTEDCITCPMGTALASHFRPRGGLISLAGNRCSISPRNMNRIFSHSFFSIASLIILFKMSAKILHVISDVPSVKGK